MVLLVYHALQGGGNVRSEVSLAFTPPVETIFLITQIDLLLYVAFHTPVAAVTQREQQHVTD